MRLEQETRELADALCGNSTADEVADEAADIANFAMMIADSYSERKLTDMRQSEINKM
jgi:NTP pyrophosphatase (non-canonical NTP hydrolase)